MEEGLSDIGFAVKQIMNKRKRPPNREIVVPEQ
jgi:hypothetical protein